MDVIELFQLIEQGGSIALLLVIIVGGARKWWVFGWVYKDLETENEDWKERALRSTELAKSTTDTAGESIGALSEVIKAVDKIREANSK